MNQKERARLLIDKILEDPLNADHQDELKELLGEAQNKPPQGQADGSIDSDLWYILGGITTAGHAFRDRLRNALEMYEQGKAKQSR